MKKFNISKNSKKKFINQNFQFLQKNSGFPNFSKKKKKKTKDQNFQKKKKKRRKFSKKALGLGALDSYFLGCLKGKINQNFQFHEKIQDFQNFQKKKKGKFSKNALGLGALGSYFLGFFQKKNQNFQFLEKIQDF